MPTPAEISLLAKYNAWMNTKLYEGAATLPEEVLQADRKAFFGSIVGTFNHLVVADTIWLKRFATHPLGFAALAPVVDLPAPKALNEVVFADLSTLTERRRLLDRSILDFGAEMTDAHLQTVFHYRNTKGIPSQKAFSSVLMHFFNHQAHHRGQLTTLLFQAGFDPGVTDLLALIPNEADI
ncbi:MAG TPA: DinB family protein [Rhodocyclaceae bacterium]|nr:DinB family protein [Rhodocyclaceae bacterium]